jgi:hypothetical protein
MEDPVFEFRDGQIFFTFLKRANRCWDPPILQFNGYRGLFHGTKRSGRNNEHSYTSSVEVKNGWSCTSTLPTRLYDMDRYGFILIFQVKNGIRISEK